MMQNQKGFTIIELIVVIAIIAVLATIVMINVTQYIAKAKDAAIEGNLANIQSQAAVYYDTNTNYTALCSNDIVISALSAADAAFDGNATPNQVTDCNASTTAWAACGQLKNTDAYYCVDSTGDRKTVTTRTTCVTSWAATVCP